MPTHHRRLLAGPALAAVLGLAGAGLSACSDEDDNAPAPFQEAEVPEIRGEDDPGDAYVGLLDAAFRQDLEAYSSLEVTVRAEVAEVLSPRAFTVTSPDDEDVDPVLVLTTSEAADVDPEAGAPLVIAATAQEEPDPGAAAEELGLDVDPGRLADWEGDVYLVATIIEPAT